MGTQAQPVSRKTVQAFYEAYAKRDQARLADLIDDDVVWTITGPVDLMDFCGTRHGKAAALDLFGPQIPGNFKITGFKPEAILVDGDRASMIGRLSGLRRVDGRRISYQLAHFIRFRDNKIVEFRSLIDSFDAAEQLLGHSIDLSSAARGAIAGDVIAI